METFKTSTGKIASGKELQKAIEDVSDDYIALFHAIRIADEYANHITEQQKDKFLKDGLMYAERVRRGEEHNLSVLQRINTKLTGVCIAILS